MQTPYPGTVRNLGTTGQQNQKIVLQGSKLKLLANLQRADQNSFQAACQRLCSITDHEVVLDLTHCTYVSSLVIGTLVDTIAQLKTDGKEVSVFVSPDVGRFLNMAHLYHLFSYEIVEPESRPEKRG